MHAYPKLILVFSIALFLVSFGCNNEPDTLVDQFECGTPSQANGGKPKICDRPGEFCLCSPNRCATKSDTCTSGFEYVFHKGPGKCVEQGETKPRIPPGVTGDRAFCPGEGRRATECGRPETEGCLANEVCICPSEKCATPDAEKCGRNEYRYVGTDECTGEVRSDLVLHSTDSRSLCPAYDKPRPECGIPRGAEGIFTCSPGERCICMDDVNKCVFQIDDANCPSGYAWSTTHRCVQNYTRAVIRGTQNDLGDDDLCPDYGESAGADVGIDAGLDAGSSAGRDAPGADTDVADVDDASARRLDSDRD